MKVILIVTICSILCLLSCKASRLSDDVNFIEITLSIFSGRPDPVFTVLSTNPNFTSILATAKHRPSSQLPSILGYRGFEVKLVTHKGANQTVTIAKCTASRFEEKLLYTVSRLPDQHGTRLYRTLVEQIDNAIKSCTGKIDFMQITLSVYSGTRDPKFNLIHTNPNFTSIATTVSTRTSTPLAGLLGYRGFEVKFHETGQNGTEMVTIGKYSCPGLEMQTSTNHC